MFFRKEILSVSAFPRHLLNQNLEGATLVGEMHLVSPRPKNTNPRSVRSVVKRIFSVSPPTPCLDFFFTRFKFFMVKSLVILVNPPQF